MNRLRTQFPRDPLVLEALKLFEQGDIPEKAYYAFKAQVDTAKQRGIAFEFNIRDWWNWWQVDGRWHHRGVGTNKLVMARKGDVGPYSANNVYSCTHQQNIADITPENRREISATLRRTFARKRLDPNFEHHLAVRGDGHPKSRAVMTPKGRFGSIALAAEAFGLTRAGAFYRVKRGDIGWYYCGIAP